MDAYSKVMSLRRLRALFLLLRSGVALGMIGIILGLAPFAVAQDVHHELAAADTDGHEHSDTDICQWVQHHTSNSLQAVLPVLESYLTSVFVPVHLSLVVLSFHPFDSSPPRAPPQS